MRVKTFALNLGSPILIDNRDFTKLNLVLKKDINQLALFFKALGLSHFNSILLELQNHDDLINN